MTSIFLKYFFFRFQKKQTQKYTVSSAIQWLVKNRIMLHDINTSNTRKIRYRRTIHKQTKIISAAKLKCLLKIYLKSMIMNLVIL